MSRVRANGVDIFYEVAGEVTRCCSSTEAGPTILAGRPWFRALLNGSVQ